MGRRARTVLGLAAVVLVAVVAWWLVRAGNDGDAVPTGDAAAPAGATPELPAAPALPTPELGDESALLKTAVVEGDTSQPAAEGARAELVVTLHRGADDSPIADAEVFIAGNSVGVDPPRHVRARGRTGADGTWRTDFDCAVQIWEIVAKSGPDHAQVRAGDDVDIALGQSRTALLVARRGATVSGQVVDETERPVPGAEVLAWVDMQYQVVVSSDRGAEPDARATCDHNGRFELSGVGPMIVLAAAAPGRAAVMSLSGQIADGSRNDGLVLRVGPAHALRGRVIDPDGRPVKSAWVTASIDGTNGAYATLYPDRPVMTEDYSDAEGLFAIEPLAAGEWTVSARSEPWQPWSQHVSLDGSELLITLSSGLSLTGAVVGADGAPLEGARLSLIGASSPDAFGDWASAVTTGGQFRFDALMPTEQAALSVVAAGHAVHVVPVLAIDASTPPLEITLEAEHLIAGRVVDEQDRPLEGAQLEVRGDRLIDAGVFEGQTWEQAVTPSPARATSDAEGRFRFERLYDGLFDLTVVDPRAQGWRHTQSVRSGVDDLLIRLDPALLRRAALSGTVRDGVSRNPVEDFRIWLFPMDPERQKPGMRLSNGGEFKEAGGVFNLQGIEPGRWRAIVDAEGYARMSSDELELREGEQHVDLELLPERSLRMRIVDQDHEPVYGAFVHFEDARGQRIELEAQPLGSGTIGMTDKAGELTANGLPADRITIVLKLSLVPGWYVGRREVRLSVDLRVQREGIQEFTIERRRVRCLMLSFGETSAAVAVTVYDTEDESASAALKPLIMQDLMRPSERPITVTVTDGDGVLVDTARCQPNASAPGKWSVTSSVCSTDEPASWLATALPTGPSRAVITAEGCEPVTLDLPGGDEHMHRYVILRPVAQH